MVADKIGHKEGRRHGKHDNHDGRKVEYLPEEAFCIGIVGVLQKKRLPCEPEYLDDELQYDAESGHTPVDAGDVGSLEPGAVNPLYVGLGNTDEQVPVDQVDKQARDSGRNVGETDAKKVAVQIERKSGLDAHEHGQHHDQAHEGADRLGNKHSRKPCLEGNDEHEGAHDTSDDPHDLGECETDGFSLQSHFGERYDKHRIEPEDQCRIADKRAGFRCQADHRGDLGCEQDDRKGEKRRGYQKADERRRKVAPLILVFLDGVGCDLQVRSFQAIGKKHVGQGDVGIDDGLNAVIEGGECVRVKRNEDVVQAPGENGARSVDDRILGKELELGEHPWSASENMLNRCLWESGRQNRWSQRPHSPSAS